VKNKKKAGARPAHRRSEGSAGRWAKHGAEAPGIFGVDSVFRVDAAFSVEFRVRLLRLIIPAGAAFMEFLGIGPLELLVIFLIVLIIFSPKDLTKGGKTVGSWMNRLNKSDTWKSMQQISHEMQNLPSRLAREAQLEELKEMQEGIEADLENPEAEKTRPAALPPASSKAPDGPDLPPKTGPQDETVPPSQNIPAE
jgi:Sec-independent protein translocase protein TatA